MHKTVSMDCLFDLVLIEKKLIYHRSFKTEVALEDLRLAFTGHHLVIISNGYWSKKFRKCFP